MPNQDGHIILDKELRRDIDVIIQRIKDGITPVETGVLGEHPFGRSSRERSLAVTKLQEAVMWLDMDLKAIADENKPNEEAIEAEAKAIYEVKFATDPAGKVWPWMEGGNSLKQQEARDEARAKLSVLPNPYPNSKDPSNAKIDATADGLKM